MRRSTSISGLISMTLLAGACAADVPPATPSQPPAVTPSEPPERLPETGPQPPVIGEVPVALMGKMRADLAQRGAPPRATRA